MTAINHRYQFSKTDGVKDHFDAIVLGAGVGGLYALHHLREMGLSVRVYDGAAGVGGTWWWNRYPGARVDGPGSPFYCYTFSEDLVREWDWAETQPDQQSVLAYLEYVADRPGDVRLTKANIQPLLDLGWEPMIDISEGIERCFSEFIDE